MVRERDAIVIVVADDGAGFDPAAMLRGHGLRNMRSRAQRIGMRIAIDSARGQGTRVTLEFPLTQTAALAYAAARG